MASRPSFVDDLIEAAELALKSGGTEPPKIQATGGSSDKWLLIVDADKMGLLSWTVVVSSLAEVAQFLETYGEGIYRVKMLRSDEG